MKQTTLQWSDIPKSDKVKAVVEKIVKGELSIRGAKLNAPYKTALALLFICEDYKKKHPLTVDECLIRDCLHQKNNHNIKLSFVMALQQLIRDTFTLQLTKDMVLDALEYIPVPFTAEYRKTLGKERSKVSRMQRHISTLQEKLNNRADLMAFVKPDKLLPAVEQEQFLVAAREKYGDRYDYTKVNYRGENNSVLIGCPEHGYFSITPKMFLQGDSEQPKIGCPHCASEMSFGQQFLKKARAVHGTEYEYSCLPKKPSDIIYIKCKEHGFFPQRADVHITGSGCPYCKGYNLPVTERRALFIASAKNRYGNRFDYSQVVYVNKNTPVRIICKEHNYPFDVLPESHLRGREGCPLCNNSVGENEIRTFLDRHQIAYKAQYVIPNESADCKRTNLRVDFYIPSRATIIEFHGEQHYKDIDYFYKGKDWTFADQQKRDQALRDYCLHHGIFLIEIPYTEHDKIYKRLYKYFVEKSL